MVQFVRFRRGAICRSEVEHPERCDISANVDTIRTVERCTYIDGKDIECCIRWRSGGDLVVEGTLEEIEARLKGGRA